MKALTFHGIENIQFETVNDPTLIEPTDVIVKVDISAICGSDLHIYHGRETGLDQGTIMGHEFTGDIVETGNEVRQLKNGTKVISPFLLVFSGNLKRLFSGLRFRFLNLKEMSRK